MFLPSSGNLFERLPNAQSGEMFEDVLRLPGVRIERIVSQGQASPEDGWYDQSGDEWVLVLEGAATLLFEDDAAPMRMARGAFVHIPAHRRHRVTWTHPDRPTIWLAVHIDR